VLEALYDRLIAASRKRHAPAVMAAVSFADSSFFPFPPHPFLAALIMADPSRAYGRATLCTVASVLGAFLGYAIGDLLFDTLGQCLVRSYGYERHLDAFRELFAEWGFWLIAGKGLTPIPFKIVTIGAGIAQYPLLPFFVASVLARGVQFYALAWLLKHQGSTLERWFRRYARPLGWLALAALVGGIAWFELR
jgi:membrane protein YqaA with SNARE-associated domain